MAGWLTLTLRNRHLLWLLIAISLVAGLSTFATIPRLEDPRIVNRGPLVLTPFPGASAERVESLVSDPIETALEEIDEIKTIESTSRAGISVISIELLDRIEAGENLEVFSEIRDKLRDIESDLPPGAGAPDFDDKRDAVAYTLVLSVGSRGERGQSIGVISRQAEELADRLRQVPSTELVRVFGGAQEEIRVRLDGVEAASMGLSAVAIARLIDQADSRSSAGIVRGSTSDVLIEVTGELNSLERIASIPLREGEGGRVIRLSDVATIERGIRTPVETMAFSDSNRGVLVAARMSSEAQAEAWAAQAGLVADEFQSERAGVEVARVFEQTAYTTDRLNELGANLLAGAGVILVVVWLTMGIRQAFIIGAALPLVVSLTVTLIQMSGNSLHQMSVFGMIIALGLLIDNAIVVTDEVTARRRNGAGQVEAMGGTVRHLAGPLGASTLTTVLAFAPILLLPGSGGDFVGSIGQSVIYAVVVSFFVSLSIIAALAGLFVSIKPQGERRWWIDGIGSARLARVVEAAFKNLFKRPVAAIALAAVLPLTGFVLARTLGNQFFPPVDRDMFHVQVWLPSESSLERTALEAERADEIIASFEGVERTHWLVGGSYPSVWYNLIMDKDAMPSYAHGIVDTTSARMTKSIVPRLQAELDARLPGAQVVVRSFGQGPPVVADVEYRVSGPDLLTLQELGEAFRVRLQAHPDVLHTQMTMERAEPKLWFDVDEQQARLAGLTLNEISSQLEAAYEGVTGGEVIEDLEEMPVRVSFDEDARGRLATIASTRVMSSAGTTIALPALAEPALRPERGAITRYNGSRANTVKAYTRAGALPIDIGESVLAEITQNGPELPPGYTISVGGASEQNDDATGNLAKYAPVLVVLMIATLILTFRSILLAAVLGCVALMSVGLALLSTWTISFPVSFNTILGTLGLIGVALNDSIVVVASLREHPTAKLGDPRGIAEAIMGCLRHVISTTLTTIGGFLPLLLFVGGDFWPSLAIVMAGGITGATLLAVLFVPAAFRLIVMGGARFRGQPFTGRESTRGSNDGAALRVSAMATGA
ncbi:MAG: efflux RND transporter permease subunit [Planctomycetota bacterium]